MIFFDFEMEDRAQVRGARLSLLFLVLCGLLGTMSPFPGAERVIPHGLLPPLASPHQGWYEEGAEVQPAAWGRGFVSSLCLHADCQILGICQQGHWPVTSLCQWGRFCVSFPNVCSCLSSVLFLCWNHLHHLIVQQCWATRGSSVAISTLIAELEKVRTPSVMYFIVAEFNFPRFTCHGLLKFYIIF